MRHDNRITVRRAYRRLLALYPRPFRERFGESMGQTFDDLCHERRRRGGRAGLVPWMFLETAAGICMEHIRPITEGDGMINSLTKLKSPAIISLALVIPFALLELANRRNIPEDFPIPLFVILWLLPAIFLLTLRPIVRSVQAGNKLLANPVSLLLRAALLVFLAYLWAGILIDQMPCFLGVPNCD
jgi:hypothetical protein